MHNKFCVGKQLLTGSTNPTKKGFINYNHWLVINSTTLENNYWQELQEIINRDNEKTEHTKINLSGILVENYFCPEDNCEEKVLKTLRKANESIKFMLFTFTSQKISDLLLEKSETINVKGLMDNLGLNEYTKYYQLKEHMPILLERTDKTLHHKVFIIDDKTVITGSYNPTKSANTRNDENILIIHNEGIAEQFLQEFERITFLINKDFRRSR